MSLYGQNTYLEALTTKCPPRNHRPSYLFALRAVAEWQEPALQASKHSYSQRLAFSYSLTEVLGQRITPMPWMPAAHAREDGLVLLLMKKKTKSTDRERRQRVSLLAKQEVKGGQLPVLVDQDA
jgi:hypothetical protein